MDLLVNSGNVSGYKHPLYAQSFSKFGEPIYLSFSQGWLIKRKIANHHFFDAMGLYPIFSCQNWSGLCFDIEVLSARLVSLALVTDPFGDFNQSDLIHCFNNMVKPFKMHFVVDLGKSLKTFVSRHHQRYARKALQNMQIELASPSQKLLDDWVQLYDALIERHQITGMRSFSKKIFRQQLLIPGTVLFQATMNQEIVGMLVWYIQGEVAYYHLGAYSPLGYQLHASFGLFLSALEYFADIGMKWLDLGAGAGLQEDSEDGLTRFKRGWSNGKRTAYFCGHIFDQKRYQELTFFKKIKSTDYFPAYRESEFG